MTNRELNRYRDLPLSDSHLHPVEMRPLEASFETFRTVMDYYEYKRVTLCCLTNSTHVTDPMDNLKGVYLKDTLNAHFGEERVFIYGNPMHYYDARDTAEGYLRQVQAMYDWGVDGYKILDGKPALRKQLNRPLCDPIFDSMYAFIEEKGLPVKMHLGDPAYFWGDKSHMNEYAIARNWWYGGGGFSTLESLREEVDGILTKFPKLKLCLAHFYFLSEEPETLRAFFEKWENVSVDLTPGGEMFMGITTHYDTYQTFFRDYSHRIFFGTDTYNAGLPSDLEKVANGRCNLVRRMMEWNPADEFELKIIGYTPTVKPLGLPDSLLRNIYFDNHYRLHPVCRPLNRSAIRDAVQNFDTSLFATEYREMEEANLAILRAHFA